MMRETISDDINLDSESKQLQRSSNLIGEVFRSLLNSKGREHSWMTVKTTKMIGDKTTNQVTRRQNLD